MIGNIFGRVDEIFHKSTEEKDRSKKDEMRVLVVSDTHRKHDSLEYVLENEKNLDYVIHLGDAEGFEDYIEELCSCPVFMVAGNNDFYSQLPAERIIMLGEYRILLTHGHFYYVEAGIDRLMYAAEEKEADVVMFGHTHYPLVEDLGDLVIVNPGSLTHPRQPGRKPSYIIMEIDKNGKIDFEIKYVDPETL